MNLSDEKAAILVADKFRVDVPLDQANPNDFDALLLPGGALNPDKLRKMPQALEFVRGFDEQDKPIAVICHGPWTLISAGLVNGRKSQDLPAFNREMLELVSIWEEVRQKELALAA